MDLSNQTLVVIPESWDEIQEFINDGRLKVAGFWDDIPKKIKDLLNKT